MNESLWYRCKGENTDVANAKEVLKMYGNKKKRVASYQEMVEVSLKSLKKASSDLLDEKQKKKEKDMFKKTVIVNKQKVLKNKKFVRYYFISNNVLLKDKIFDLVKLGDKIFTLSQNLINEVANEFLGLATKKNMYTEIKNQKNLSDNQVINNIKVFNKIEKDKWGHRGAVDGIKINEKEEVVLNVGSTLTSKPMHEIKLDLTNKEVKILNDSNNLNIKYFIPTISTPDNKAVMLGKDFKMYYKGFVKIPFDEKNEIVINNNNTMEMPKGLGQEMCERNKGAMVEIGWKDYEFFCKGGCIYGVHEDYIKKIGGLIVDVDLSKAKPVSLLDYGKICKEIANNPRLDKFINVDLKTKNMFEGIYKKIEDLKKD